MADCRFLAAQYETQLILNGVIFFGKFVAIRWEQGPRRIVHDTQKLDVALGFFDLAVKLLSVIADTDKLDEYALAEDDAGADEQSQQEVAHGVDPSWLWLNNAVCNESSVCDLIDNHPKHKGQRALESCKKQNVFLNTRTHDTDEELENAGKEVSNDLANPEAEPD